MKTLVYNFSQGIDAMTDRRMLPNGFAVVMDNVDLRTGYPKPFKAPSFAYTAHPTTTRIWEFLGKWYLSDHYRNYTGEVTQTQQRIYFAEEGPGHVAPQKIVNDVQDALGTPVPTAPLLVSDGAVTVPKNLTLTQSGSGNLAPSTLYAYRVAARMANGILQPCQESQITLDASHHAVLLTWSSVVNAVGYVVFGRTGSQEQFIKDVGLQLSFLDDGTLAPSGAFASTYDSNNPYTYVYTYVRSVGTMEDESGPSPLSVVLNTGNGRVLTRQVQVDGFMDGATVITSGETSLASQFKQRITGMIFQDGGTIITFAAQPFGPWNTGDGLRVIDNDTGGSGKDYSVNGQNMAFDIFSFGLDTPLGFTINGAPFGSGSSFTAGTYIWKIAAVRGAASVTTGANASTIPTASSSSVIVGVGQHVKMSWQQVAGASFYQIYRSADAGVTWNLAKTLPASTYTYTDDGTNEATGVTLPSVNHTQDHVFIIQGVDLTTIVPQPVPTTLLAWLGKTVIKNAAPQVINQNDSVVLAGAAQSQLNGVLQATFNQVDVVATTNVNVAAPGTSTFDGIILPTSSITAPKLVLLTAQTSGSENGPWLFNGSANPLTRPQWYASGLGAFIGKPDFPQIYVRNGVVHAGKLFQLDTTGSITVDTTSTAWSQTTTCYAFIIAQYSANNDTFTSLSLLSGVGHYTVWRIYRSGDTPNFLLVAEVPVSQATYEDTVPTTALGQTLPTSYTDNGFVVTFQPPSSDMQQPELFNGMLFMHSANVLSWSPIGLPDAFPQAFQLTFSYPILYKAAFASGLIVMCQDAIYRLDGFGPTTLSLQKTLIEDGLIAPRSVQKTSHGLIYLARRGVMLTDGNTAVCLTDTKLPYSFFIQPGTYTEPYSKQDFWWYTTDHTVGYASLAWDSNSPIAAQNTLAATIQADVPQQGPIYGIRSFVYRGKYFLFYSDEAPDYKANTMVSVDLALPERPVTLLGAKAIDAHVTALGDAFVLLGNAGQPDALGDITLWTYSTAATAQDGVAYSGGFLYEALDTCIFKIDRITGVATLFVGDPSAFGQTDGTGMAARFVNIQGLTWNPDGNLYAVELLNCRVTKITPSGVVTTIFTSPIGNGGASGITSHPITGELYFTSDENFLALSAGPVIMKMTTGGVATLIAGGGAVGHVDAVGTSAVFSSMYGLDFDSTGSNLYICDFGNNCIRQMTVPGLSVTTPVGTLTNVSGFVDGAGNAALFNGPAGITRKSDTAFYIADHFNQAIRLFNPSTLGVSTYSTIALPPKVITNDGTNVYASAYLPGVTELHKFGLVPQSPTDDSQNLFAFIGAEAKFNTVFMPGATSYRNIYKWEGSDQRIPIFIRTGEFNVGLPQDRKFWGMLNFYGEGTAQIRVYNDGVLISQTTLDSREAPNKPRRINLPLGTKGYGLSFELVGDYNHRATEICYNLMPNQGGDS